ncbi:MAG: hypothetical protein H0U95_01115 [Bacteroidetes bacterium]|nr:hypothetical protein [Bacteroidota bacterium]
MKNVDQLKEQIQKEHHNYKKCLNDQDKKSVKQSKERLEFLNACLMYLESNPKESYLKEQLEFLKLKVEKISNNFVNWINSTPGARRLKSPKSAFNKEVGIIGLNNQIETLEFLLS